MNKTYELVNPSTPAMPGRDYVQIAKSELKLLLDSGERNERHFQELLEEHPCLVPGAHPETDVGGNGLYPRAVITQPKLSGLRSRFPDFCIISHDSGTVYATFVEIESPSKPWAVKSGKQSAKLTHAIGQMQEWKIWFSEQLNQATFLRDFRLPDWLLEDRTFEQRYILVYGRRKEMQEARFQKRRAEIQAPDECLMTWDRIAPNPVLYSAITVRLTSSGYTALRVPPTLQLGPTLAREYSIIIGKEAAVNNSRLIPPARAEFLMSRWEYWDEWARQDNRGLDLQSFMDCE